MRMVTDCENNELRYRLKAVEAALAEAKERIALLEETVTRCNRDFENSQAKLAAAVEERKTGGAILMMCANDLKAAEARIAALEADKKQCLEERNGFQERAVKAEAGLEDANKAVIAMRDGWCDDLNKLEAELKRVNDSSQLLSDMKKLLAENARLKARAPACRWYGDCPAWEGYPKPAPPAPVRGEAYKRKLAEIAQPKPARPDAECPDCGGVDGHDETCILKPKRKRRRQHDR